jgi:hypothetical protein
VTSAVLAPARVAGSSLPFLVGDVGARLTGSHAGKASTPSAPTSDCSRHPRPSRARSSQVRLYFRGKFDRHSRHPGCREGAILGSLIAFMNVNPGFGCALVYQRPSSLYGACRHPSVKSVREQAIGESASGLGFLGRRRECRQTEGGNCEINRRGLHGFGPTTGDASPSYTHSVLPERPRCTAEVSRPQP